MIGILHKSVDFFVKYRVFCMTCEKGHNHHLLPNRKCNKFAFKPIFQNVSEAIVAASRTNVIKKGRASSCRLRLSSHRSPPIPWPAWDYTKMKNHCQTGTCPAGRTSADILAHNKTWNYLKKLTLFFWRLHGWN